MSDVANLIVPATKPSLRAERCEMCAGFQKNAIGQDGECRLESPKMQLVPMPNRLGQAELRSLAGWPPVARDAWCLDFRPKEVN